MAGIRNQVVLSTLEGRAIFGPVGPAGAYNGLGVSADRSGLGQHQRAALRRQPEQRRSFCPGLRGSLAPVYLFA